MTTPNDPYEGQPAPEHGAVPHPAAPPPQQPAYYGQAPYYGPPTPHPPSRVAWFFIGAAAMLGVGVVGIIGFFTLVGLLLGDDFDGDGYYYVDQRSVINAVEGPCANMRSAASDIKLFSDPAAAAKDIQGFALATKGVIDAIEANEPDDDSKAWRDDWATLKGDLDAYAAALVKDGSTAEYSSTLGPDNEPVMSRMSYSSDADCEVPMIIEALDPELADYYDY